MTRKKLLALLLALCMVLSLVLTACEPGDAEGSSGPESSGSPSSNPSNNPGPGPEGPGPDVPPGVVEQLFVGQGTNGNFQYNGKFYVDYSSLEEAQMAAHAFAVQIAAEGITLLKNENNALPLSADETNVTLLGIRTARMIRSGFGSGAGGGSAISNLLGEALEAAGFSVNPKTVDLYIKEVSQMVEDKIRELGMEYYGSSITSTYASYGDAAILTFSRTGA